MTALRSLPSTVRLRLRTSTGHELTCAPADIRISEMLVSPLESCYISVLEHREHLSGFGDNIPWVALLFGDHLLGDGRVVLI